MHCQSNLDLLTSVRPGRKRDGHELRHTSSKMICMLSATHERASKKLLPNCWVAEIDLKKHVAMALISEPTPLVYGHKAVAWRKDVGNGQEELE